MSSLFIPNLTKALRTSFIQGPSARFLLKFGPKLAGEAAIEPNQSLNKIKSSADIHTTYLLIHMLYS